MKDLSIIMPSFNTKEITLQSIHALLESLSQTPLTYEIIVVDNASVDGSLEVLKDLTSKLRSQRISLTVLPLVKNYGFGYANNVGFEKATGRYVLCLNSDAIIEDVDFKDVLRYMDSHSKVGALTVRVNLKDGSIDPASHRGFPTLWRSLMYFSKLEKIAGNIPLINRVVGGYHLTYLSLDKIHEIDAPTGAFLLIRKSILDALKGFDTDYFMYGEDLDLSYRMHKLGYKTIYYPRYTVKHLKYQSGIQTKDQITREKIRWHFYDAMRIFYRKHYESLYPSFFNSLIEGIIYRKMKQYEN